MRPVAPHSEKSDFTPGLDAVTFWVAVIVATLTLIILIGWYIWFCLENRPEPPPKKIEPKIPLSKVYADMWEARKKLPPEDQEWFDTVSNLAEIPRPTPHLRSRA